MSQWYYARAGQTFGPFSDEQLRDLARTGKLLPDDLVSQPGAAQWHPAGSIRGLFGDSLPASARPQPPEAVRVAPTQAQPVVSQPFPAATPAGNVSVARSGGLMTTVL